MRPFALFLLALLYAADIQAQSSCPPGQDANQDGLIGVDDLMDLLSHWGDTDADADGVYDSVDDCVGEYDECGVCNGLGIPDGYCTCSLMIDALGDCGGDCAEDFDGDGICDEYSGPCFGMETVIFDGFAYDVVAIGNQCWFSQNLRTELYANGDSIPDLPISAQNNEGTQVVYDNNIENLEFCGRLYNGWAVEDPRGICPVGWRVPSLEDFTALGSYLGGNELAGNELKSSPTDPFPWNGSNSSGFSALPVGYAHISDGFELYSEVTQIWSSTQSLSNASQLYYFWLNTYNDQFVQNATHRPFGFSVRCIKD